MGSTIGNISSGQVLQYESSSCYADGSYKYEEYHESYMKIDGSKTGKDEYKESKGFAVISAQGYDLSHFSKADEIRRKKLLNNSYGSFKGLKEDRRDSQENNLKSGRSRLVPSVSFNDKILSASAPKGKLSVFRLSFKRKSGDGEEASERCKYSSFVAQLKFNFSLSTCISMIFKHHYSLVVYFYFPNVAYRLLR